MQFELWLMGQNASIQKEYWEIFKDTNWNKDIKIMPKYSVLEVCLEDKIDFENKETMTAAIIDKSIFFALEVQRYIENIK